MINHWFQIQHKMFIMHLWTIQNIDLLATFISIFFVTYTFFIIRINFDQIFDLFTIQTNNFFLTWNITRTHLVVTCGLWHISYSLIIKNGGNAKNIKNSQLIKNEEKVKFVTFTVLFRKQIKIWLHNRYDKLKSRYRSLKLLSVP